MTIMVMTSRFTREVKLAQDYAERLCRDETDIWLASVLPSASYQVAAYAGSAAAAELLLNEASKRQAIAVA